MTWVGGTISGFGTLSIAGGATLALGGGNFSYVDETLDGVALDNAGAASFSGGAEGMAPARTAPGSTTSRAASFTFQTTAVYLQRLRRRPTSRTRGA